MKDKKKIGQKLEDYVVSVIKIVDKYARRTKASGASTEIGDIYSTKFYVECKRKLTKENIIVDYKKDYLRLVRQIPINKPKLILLVIENKHKERFAIMPLNDFESLLKQIEKE